MVSRMKPLLVTALCLCTLGLATAAPEPGAPAPLTPVCEGSSESSISQLDAATALAYPFCACAPDLGACLGLVVGMLCEPTGGCPGNLCTDQVLTFKVCLAAAEPSSGQPACSVFLPDECWAVFGFEP